MEIKQEIRQALKKAVEAKVKIHIGVVRDEDGVPLPFPILSPELKEENIIFELPRTFPAYEKIKKFPEVSLSFVDMESIWKWDNPTGLQVKGIAKEEGGKFKLEIFEIYDVLPRAGVDLNIPIYRKKLMWMETRFMKKFNFERNFKPVPQNVVQEVNSVREKVHSKGFPAVVLTINPSNGVPNVSPRWIVELSEKSWVYGDSTRHKTQINAESPSPVSIAIYDFSTETGVLGIGWVSTSESPELKKKIEEFWKTRGFNAQAIRVNEFHPEEIYRLSRIGMTKIYELRKRNEWLKLS